jgi:hypothetical protein
MFVPPSQGLYQVVKKGKRSVRDRSLMADLRMSDKGMLRAVEGVKILNFWGPRMRRIGFEGLVDDSLKQPAGL